MSDSTFPQRHIKTEADLWDALRAALDYKGDNAPFGLDFSEADWAKIRVKYTGKRFNRSLTPSAMEGLVELQASLYRAASVVLRGRVDARRLTETERQALELTFVVGPGSSTTEAKGKDILQVVGKAVSRMSGKQITIAAIVLGLGFLTERGLVSYIKTEAETADKTHMVELSKEIMKHDEEQAKLLARSLSQSPQAAEVQSQAASGFGEVVKRAGAVDSVTVQGTELSREHVEEARKTKRRSSQNITIKETFTITLVDPSTRDGFTVWLKSSKSGEVIKASLLDSFTSDKTKSVIRNAEWKKQKITVKITGRRLGAEFVDGRIISAVSPPSSGLLIRDARLTSKVSV